MNEERKEKLNKLIQYIESEIKPHTLNEKGKSDFRYLLGKYHYDLDFLEDCVDIAAAQYLEFDENGNVRPKAVDCFLDKIGGIAHCKTLPPIEAEILHIKNICNAIFYYFDYQKADEIIRSYIDLLKEIGCTEEEILNDLKDKLIPICRNSRNWTNWKGNIYDRMALLMDINGIS